MTTPAAPSPAASVLERLHLSLTDVAELARVQRPVVSTWRRRHAGSATPFPQPLPAPGAVPAGVPAAAQRFRATEVADWIETTGLGNTDTFRADLALRAVLDDPFDLPRDVAFDGLTALLCLKTHASEPLGALSRGELLDLADDVDPDDDHLYAEVAALGDATGRLCELADHVASAAYTPAGALESLLADRHRTGSTELSRSALAPAAIALVAHVVAALVRDVPAGPSPVVGPTSITDPHPGTGDLLAAILTASDEPLPARLPAAAGRRGERPRRHRLARRRLVAQGGDVLSLPLDEDGRAHLDARALVVTQLPATGESEPTDEAVLEAIDDVVLQLAPGQRAVVIGPASALVDAPTSPEAGALRDAILRTGRLRTAVRLPPGLVPERSRQLLALWVLGDAHPDVPIADRWVMVADLADRPARGGAFPRAVVDDLLTDVVASLGSAASVRAHTFRFARFVPVPEVLVASGDLVAAARPVVGGPRDDGGVAAVRVRDLLEVVARERAAEPELDVTVERGEPRAVRRVPLGRLVAQGLVRKVPGNRVEARDVGHEQGPGRARVVGAAELAGAPWGGRTIDRLAFAAAYPAGRFTEPGDVVFCTAPEPAAVVDVEGFSVVEFPAQVLRVREVGGGLVPEVLARDVAAQALDAKRPEAWEVRLVPGDQVAGLAGALAQLRRRQEALRREGEHLEEVAATLTAAVAAGVVRMRQDDQR